MATQKSSVTKLVGLFLVLGLVAFGAPAFAHGPGYGYGGGMMGGYGGMMGGWGQGYGPMMYGNSPGYGPGMMYGNSPYNDEENSKFYQDTAKLRNDLYQKQTELNAVLSANKVDEQKAKGLQSDINKLENELQQKQLDAAIQYRKDHPGQAAPYGGGFGPGARYCWR